ncbi:MAG: lysophospholipid acyltransferase family protein [Candidatus Krumholzibacteria bacterium]|nr:lysophospholipid acyltransferase family protein [Candidatus Krumholzibacteria bacterium]
MALSYWKRLRHRIELAGVRLLIRLPAVLPLRWSVRAGGEILGRIAFDTVRIRRRVTLENLERAFGGALSPAERARIGRRSYINFAKSMIEFASIGRLGGQRLRRLVAVRDRRHIDGALSRGKGVVVVTGHFGSWELLGAASVAHGMPADFLVGEQSNKSIDDLINGLRRAAGIGIIARGIAARGVFASLKAGRMVALLSDQDARRAGIFVEFFGIPSSTYPGAAQFALRTGAPIVCCFIVRNPDETHEAIFLPPIEPDQSAPRDEETARLTGAYTRALEEAVRKHPDHYFWAHRRWKTRPPRENAVAL